MLEGPALALLIGRGKSDAQDDAAKYVRRRKVMSGVASTLRKARRAKRIAAGLRPLKVATEHVIEVAGGEVRFTLHPTKGRRNIRFEPDAD